MIVSVILSFLSLFNGASGIFKHLKHIQFDDQEYQMPKYSWKSKFGIFLSFLMTIGPRLLILTYFFGNCDLMVFSVASFFIACSIFVITYCVTFLLPTVLMYQKLKAKTDSGKYLQNLLWAFISAMISPCIVIHPRSMTFLFSSIASALAHCGLLIFVHFTYIENLQKHMILNRYGTKISGMLMGFLIASLIFSFILHFLSQGKMSCYSKKDSGEESGLNEPTEQNTKDMIGEITAEEPKCKCFNWFKSKKTCKAKNIGDDCINLRFIHKQCCLKLTYYFSTFSSLLLRFYALKGISFFYLLNCTQTKNILYFGV